MKVHELKVANCNHHKYHDDKSWSIRIDDRDFAVGDICIFSLMKESYLAEEKPFYCKIIKQITRITTGYGLSDGFCILDLRLIEILTV